MSKYACPLCGQDVTKSIYEKITGIWQEKEKQMQALKTKEKALKEKEKKLLEKFALEKQKIINSEKSKFEKKFKEQHNLLKKERESIKQEKKKLKAEYDKRIAMEMSRIQKDIEKKEKVKSEKSHKNQKNRYEQLNKQFRALQSKSTNALNKATKKIESLEEQIEKNKTASELGFSSEKEFLAVLEKAFPEDSFEHTGKGGDISHSVMNKGKQIGVICYELKKVSNFSSAHITQAYKAKQVRNADYGILVTNAKRHNQDTIFDMQKGVIIIHHAGAIVLVSLLRNQLLEISKLKLSSAKRSEKVDAVLNYIQSPPFKNSIESIIIDTVELHESLQKEVKGHVNVWRGRLQKYRNIRKQADEVNSKVVEFADDKKSGKQIDYMEIASIDIPDRID